MKLFLAYFSTKARVVLRHVPSISNHSCWPGRILLAFSAVPDHFIGIFVGSLTKRPANNACGREVGRVDKFSVAAVAISEACALASLGFYAYSSVLLPL